MDTSNEWRKCAIANDLLASAGLFIERGMEGAPVWSVVWWEDCGEARIAQFDSADAAILAACLVQRALAIPVEARPYFTIGGGY